MKLLLIEGDPALCKELLHVFSRNKYHADIATDEGTAWYLLSQSIYDLIIVCSTLPDILGIDLLKKIRLKNSHIPVIFLGGTNKMENKIEALEYGADDYLSKPISVEELLATIRSLLRRTVQAQQSACLSINNLELYLDRFEVRIDNETFKLTKKETQVFALLIRKADTFVSKEMIINTVWGIYNGIEPHNVETHIHRIRKSPYYKKSGIVIETRRGVGYRLNTIPDTN